MSKGHLETAAPSLAVHIGLKKSGSATLQTFFAANAEALFARGIDYPAVGRGPRKAHHNIVHELRGKRDSDPAKGGLEQLAAHVRDADCRLAVVSSEMFESLEAAEVESLKARLDGAGRPVTIVLILRHLLDLIPSSYAQKVRNGQKQYDFDKFLVGRLAESRVSYFTTAETWAEVFGWENIRVRLLDSRHLLNGDLIDDFLATIGIDPGDPAIRALPRQAVVNTASGWRTLEAIRALYRRKSPLPTGHALEPIRANATTLLRRKKIEQAAVDAGARLGWQDDRGLYLTQAQAETILGIYAENIVALNARLASPLPLPDGLEARGFVERPFLPSASQIPRGDLIAFYDDVARRLADMPRLARPRSAGRAP